jgi:multiple sugar transport system substrate-binding protein
VTRYAKEYPDATVKVQWTPGDHTSKLNAGLLSTSGPDVFESNLNIDQVKSGQVVNLDDIIADVKSDYTEADIKSSTVDGKIYQIKMVDDMGVLYYRKSILDKAGVKPPTTIDELIAASKALNTKDQKGLFIGNDAGVTPSFGGGSLLGTILWTVGADYLTADNKPGFTTPEVKQSFAKMRDSRVGGVPWSAPSRPTSMPPKPSSSGYGSTTPRTKRTSTSVTASISRLASRWPRQRPSCSLARPRTPSRSSTRTPSRPTPPGHPR